MIHTEHEAEGTGYQIVATPISCTITRFRVKSILGLVRFYVLFRRVRRQSQQIDGLFTALFLIQDWRTCFSIALWRDAHAIIDFNNKVTAHVEAANFCFRELEQTPSGPQLWSGQFRLTAISPNNIRWEDIEIQDTSGQYFNES